MPDFFDLPILANADILAVAALVICFTGWRLSDVADTLADRTGIGEAMAGAVLLGAATRSLWWQCGIVPLRWQSAASSARMPLTRCLLLARLLPSAMARFITQLVGQQQIFFVALTMLLSTIRLMGLLYREQRGLGNVGFEGLSMLVLYIGAVILLVFNGGPS
ncbi:MAG: hypothetical protein HC914_02145 [Chloroflexaceae bacterium]|nr:hypothetical protein [Chloroflexaceae bacterium]